MPRKRPPFVECWRDRHGKNRVYFRKERGARIPLPNSIGSDEFNAAYQAALAGQLAPVRERHARAAAGTIGALITHYKQNTAYIALRETTKQGYASRIEALRTQHGHRTVAGLTRERIHSILQPYGDRPGAGLSILKMLRVLIRYAIDLGWLKHDPSLGIRRPKIERIRSWTEDEIETYRNRWALGTKQTLGFRAIFEHRAATVGCRANGLVTHHTRQQDRRRAAEDWATVAHPASPGLTRCIGIGKARSRLNPHNAVRQAVYGGRL